jgi:dTDP-4-dehydrorhamnose 3,5-epimerase
MQIKKESTHLGEIVIVSPEVFEDERGFFMETYRDDQFEALGLPTNFVQDNHSRSKRNVLRGLHFQYEPPMGKLMRVTYGQAFLVAVDLRKGSPTLGKWWGTELSAENKKWMWAPASFARGFCVLSDWAEVQYKTTATYNGQTDIAIRFDDPDIGIRWPISEPQISDRDRKAISFAQWLESPASECFQYPQSREEGFEAVSQVATRR